MLVFFFFFEERWFFEVEFFFFLFFPPPCSIIFQGRQKSALHILVVSLRFHRVLTRARTFPFPYRSSRSSLLTRRRGADWRCKECVVFADKRNRAKKKVDDQTLLRRLFPLSPRCLFRFRASSAWFSLAGESPCPEGCTLCCPVTTFVSSSSSERAVKRSSRFRKKSFSPFDAEIAILQNLSTSSSFLFFHSRESKLTLSPSPKNYLKKTTVGCAPSTLNEAPQEALGGKAAAGGGGGASAATATSTSFSTSSSALTRANSRSLRKQPSPVRAVARLLSRKSRVVGGSGADDDAEGVGAFFLSKVNEPGVGGGSFGLAEELWDCLPMARAAAAAEAAAAAAAAEAAAKNAAEGASSSSARGSRSGAGGVASPGSSSASSSARKGGSVAAASADGGGGGGTTPRGSFLSLARDTLAGALSSPVASLSGSRPGTVVDKEKEKQEAGGEGEEDDEAREALTDEQLRERITTSGGARALALPSAGFAARHAFCSLRGFYPETPDKRNQDAVCAHERFGGDPEALLLAVFDGHGNHGAACSQFAMDALPAALLADSLCRDAPELALRDAAATANRALHASPIDDSLSGTTALVALLVKDRLLVANVGDSRAVVGVARPPPPSGSGGVAAVALSWDHTPFRRDEYERVLRAGARVLTLDQMEGIKDPSKPCWTSEDADSADPPRLWMPDALYPGTAFTRSLGDAAAERIGVIPDPEVRPRTLTASDRFLVLASDGVWEFMSNQDVVDLVASEEARGDPQRASVLLCVEAYRRWLLNETRTDDITAAILWFDGEPGSNKRKKDGLDSSSSLNGSASAEGGASTVAAAIQRASMVSVCERERERERESR